MTEQPMDQSNEFILRGLTLAAEGKYRSLYDEAITRIKKNTEDASAYFVLGKISSDHNNHNKALELFKKASHLAPRNLYCQTYYAQILTLMGQQVAAKTQADIAATLPDTDHHIADTLGVIYTRTGFHELAIPWFKKSVQAQPGVASYQYNLGASLQFIGDLTGAEEAFKKAIEREPENYRALASLVQLRKQTKENHRLTALQSAFEHMRSDADAVLHLGHAIAKSFEDLGEYSTSLSWLEQAKRMKRSQSSAVEYESIFSALKALPVKQTSSTPSDGPIFIVGLPRTGTTLVDRIIGSHSAVYSAGELNLFAGLVKQASLSPSNLTLDSDTLHAAANFSSSQFETLGRQYESLSAPLTRGAPRFTDKMPLNFLYCGLIHQALPNANIIVVRRNPMDSCLSNYRQLLTTQHAYYSYTYDLETTAKFYCLFDDLIAHWTQVIPASRLLQVRYEDIVFNQKQETERLLKFCGLDWEDACLNFHENEAPVSTASSVQVRQPLYAGSIGRWRRYGDSLSRMQTILRDSGIDIMQGMPGS